MPKKEVVVTIERKCYSCGVVYSLLILDVVPESRLKCLACYVRDNPDMEQKLQTWLDNHKRFAMRGGGGNQLIVSGDEPHGGDEPRFLKV